MVSKNNQEILSQMSFRWNEGERVEKEHMVEMRVWGMRVEILVETAMPPLLCDRHGFFKGSSESGGSERKPKICSPEKSVTEP